MKRIFLILFILLTSTHFYAQSEASFWYFGQNAGLQFNAETGTVTAITNGQIRTLEGCTSIADSDGNLLFYSDGRTVWNRNHQIMANGNYFGGTGLLGDPSSTSSGLIVPKPEDPNKYYIFTVDEPHQNNASTYPNQFPGPYVEGTTVPQDDDGFNNGFNYTLIDMTLNGGLGDVDVSEKNIHLVTYDPNIPIEIQYKSSEKITAVRAEDCSSFWVITHFGDKFYAFKIDTNGVQSTPIISQVGPYIPIEGFRRNSLGYIKTSPDASKLVAANFGEATLAGGNAPGNVFLYDFNNETGTVTNPLELYSSQNGNSPYGVEFSAESKKVYATLSEGASGDGTSQILQWDLESIDILNSQQTIHSSNNVTAGALQLGIDRRIYRANLSYNGHPTISKYLGVINNPEADGLAVNYEEQGILLDINGLNQNISRIGLPPFIQSLFNSETDIIRNGISTSELKLCTNDTYTLQADDIVGADYVWSFDGVPLAETSSQLVIDTPGFYEVYIEPNNGECPIEGSAVVGVFEIPEAHPLTDVTVCDVIDNDGFTRFDFTNKNSEVLLNQDPLQYNVSYYETLEDAESNENMLMFPFVNTANPQTIFARVDNSNNTNCFAINSFEIEVFNTPQISELNTIEFCDNVGDVMDGIATIELGDLMPSISGDQTEINITFHGSQDDAEMNANALPLTYTNTSAVNETIFVRVENALNTDCFITESFNVRINPIPVANAISIIQCDEDGIPEGFTTFNLNESISDITGGILNTSVDFYSSQTDAENNENPLSADAFENYTNPQTVYARVTNTNSDCDNFSEITLEVSTTSSNNASLSLCDTDDTEDGFMTFNLTDANATVLANSPLGLDVVYYETYEDALLENNPVGSTYTNTTPNQQTIYARVENANACYGISEIELTVFNLPNIETEFETIYCLNFSPETIVLNGGVIDDSPSNYYYEWSTGENTTEIEINTPGTYTVRISNTNGCFKDRTIIVSPSNIATITQVEVVDASQNNSISVIVSGEGDYEYALDDNNGPYQDENTFNNLQPGIYTVYIRDKNNCGIIDDLVSVIGFPKFFTPNSDEVNDYWQVYGVSEQFQANSKVYIFDRYGKLLIALNPLSSGWDGTFNGEKMPTSDYWFKVTLEDGRTYTNHFTLKR
ncbi:T9SS type B sorting domain-containing protein [Winogradskyella thalassocola]|uniref:Gliding motility-associated C-terminal domain-containing protein n=1 Tax=Winogradskyella thalassocola TaxID=262004 RepID=A0A1G8EVQ7_9FLAO|nr:T9SS type B sorting domain-containing protein [Winogradskyella thalassocola]SDH73992.1 gliding motility-associated C-terminal domain-containing protein [Winogradskyella thalassocola]